MKYNIMAIFGVVMILLSFILLAITKPQCYENEKAVLSYGLNGWACARRP